MPLPTPSLPEDNARHFDPAPRELVGTAFQFPWAVPAFFDSEGQPFDHAPCCLPDADRLASAGLVSFHEPIIALTEG